MEYGRSIHSCNETAKCLLKGSMSIITHSLLHTSEEGCKSYSIVILFCVWNLEFSMKTEVPLFINFFLCSWTIQKINYAK